MLLRSEAHCHDATADTVAIFSDICGLFVKIAKNAVCVMRCVSLITVLAPITRHIVFTNHVFKSRN